MRLRLKLSALLAFMLLAFSLVGGTGVGAQDDVEEDFQPSDLEGIQYGVARSYEVDYETLYDMSTPDAEMAMPSGPLFVGAFVLEFDNDGNAEAGFTRMLQELEFNDDALSEDETFDEYDVDLGDASIGYVSVDSTDGVEIQTVIIIIQQDSFVYLVSAVGSDADMQDMAGSVAETVVANEGSGEGEFNEDGTSSGGLWDKLPAADDEMFAGLIVTDEIVYPESDDASN